jgi:mannose-1-phosphate guanylyltransferase
MLWCPHCLMWSARTPCRHCSHAKTAEPPRSAALRRVRDRVDPRHLWAILLASGEGTDFGDFSVQRFGIDVPKHLWSLDGTGGMTSWALARATRLVTRDHVVAITRAEHERWAGPRFRDLSPANVLVEPIDRGSAPGLLLALLRITQVDPEAVVVVLPCDHHVEEERKLADAVLDIAAAVARHPERIVLLGAPGEGHGDACAWVIPKSPRAPRGGPWEVGCILNKRDLPATDRLARGGAFVATGILVAPAAALVGRFAATVPDLMRDGVRWMIEASDEGEGLASLYRCLAPRDFTREVLGGSPGHLGVARIPTCGWTDLGSPADLREFLHGRKTTFPPGFPEPSPVLAPPSHA